MGDTNKILVPQMARVWLAPVGTTAPDGPTAALDAAWKDVGFFQPDSLQWATEPEFEEVQSHQSNYPTRRFQTTDAATVQCNLQEWSTTNFLAVYGGGTFDSVTPADGISPDYFKFTPPSIGGRTQTACILEIIDGTKHYRRIIPKCEQTEGVELGFDKSAETSLPLRLSVIGSDIASPWYELSDDPAMADYDAEVMADNPVAYWSGGSGEDTTGNGHTLTFFGSPGTVSLPNGDTAMLFNGVDEYADAGDAPEFSPATTGAFTIELWMRPDALTFTNTEGTGYSPVCGKIASGQAEWSARMYSDDNSDGFQNRISGLVFDADEAVTISSHFQDAVVVGEWIHYVFVIDSTAGGETTHLYKNGVLRDSDDITTHTPTDTTSTVQIARASSTGYFPGAVGKMALYGSVLAPERITAHYQAMVGN